MDGFVFLGLLALIAVLAVPICLIILFISNSGLKNRLMRVEREVLALRAKLDLALRDGVAAVAAKATVTPPIPDPSEGVSPDALSEPIPDAPTDQNPEPWREMPEDAATGWRTAAVIPPASDLPPEARPAAPAHVDQNQPIVMRRDRFADLGRWLQDNWIYAVSALSLALAGIFFVQYGIENGLLPPLVRVMLAIAFGAALIVAGEYIRRRYGDGEASSTAYLPSVFSGAGLVSIFAGIVAGRMMYGLYGPDLAFVGLLATAALAVGLGWLYGPLLVAVGLLGAGMAPFLVAGGTGPTAILYAYYGLITLTGLAVDALRRWGWVSVLALVLGFGGGAMMYAGGAGFGGWLLLLIVLPLLATAVPVLQLWPEHAGPSLSQALLQRFKRWPPFPVRLSMGAMVAASVFLLFANARTQTEGMAVLAAMTLLAVLALIWPYRARGLVDLALLPSVAFLARLLFEGGEFGPVYDSFLAQAIVDRAPEVAAPWTVTLILGMAVIISGAAALRAFRRDMAGKGFGLGAVLVAPVAAAILELLWEPALVIGAYPWAVQIMAVAAAMVLLALRFATIDGMDRRRMAWATLSALSLIALALFLLATKSALTLALAVLVVVAAALDRRFRLPEMGWFIQLGVAVLGYRLTVDPGVGWALDAPLIEVLVTYAAPIAALISGFWLIETLERPQAKGVMTTAWIGFAAIFANVLLSRWLLVDTVGGSDFDRWQSVFTHWGIMLNTLPWLVVMLVQIARMHLGGPLKGLRIAFAVFAGLIAAAGMVGAATLMNPLFDVMGRWNWVRGPVILDSLFLAYAVPGLMLVVASRLLPGLGRLARMTLLAPGAAFVVLYGGLEIRRLWQGRDLSVYGVTQPELYSYTLAMMLVGAALLYQAIARRSALLRRVGMAVIALTVAKVFLIDASGLSGLVRVVSFLGLGLSLAGLAWLNRWAAEQVTERK